MNIFAIEITNEQVVWWVGGAVALVITIGGLAKASGAIKVTLWNPFNKEFLAPRKAKKLKLAAVMDGFDELIAGQKRIEAELTTNGGKSVKDTVNRISRNVEHLQARARHQDNHSSKPTFELDANGGMTFASAAFCEMLSVDEEDLLFRNWFSRVVADERQGVIREVKEAVENKMPLESVIRFNGKRGVVTMHFIAQPYVRTGGELVGFFGMANGISVG